MKRLHHAATISLLALAAFWPAQAQADARHETYLKTAKAFVELHRLPDGEAIASEDIIETCAVGLVHERTYVFGVVVVEVSHQAC